MHAVVLPPIDRCPIPLQRSLSHLGSGSVGLVFALGAYWTIAPRYLSRYLGLPGVSRGLFNPAFPGSEAPLCSARRLVTRKAQRYQKPSRVKRRQEGGCADKPECKNARKARTQESPNTGKCVSSLYRPRPFALSRECGNAGDVGMWGR